MSVHELPGGAFILHGSGTVVRVSRESFSTEAEFQELIARHPELLAGEMITPEEPRRWLLIDREIGIADSEDGNDRWAVDHMFVDQDGTPTLVEVKRRSDSRLKRDVVAQILGYVSFATANLAGDQLRKRFESRVMEDEDDPEEVLEQFLDGERDPAKFWEEVELRMRSGDVRAIVVADSIPEELQRILEFVNEKMNSVELLGLELQLYATEDYKTLVPRVVGRTAHSRDRRKRSGGGSWTIEQVRSAIQETDVPEMVGTYDRLVSWAQESRFVEIENGTGSTYPSIRFRSRMEKGLGTFMTVVPDPRNGFSIAIYFGILADWTAGRFPEQVRVEFAQEIVDSIDPHFKVNKIDKYPSFRLVKDRDGSATLDLLNRIIARLHGQPSRE